MTGWRTGNVIDQEYRLIERIGEGGMGEVWRAERRSAKSLCCLKSLTIAHDAELAERFRREGLAQARVDAHPNVTRVHTLGLAEGRPYLVTDLADGGDLNQRLRTGGALEPAAAAELVRDLASGLAHVHAQGVLHRDLKPANVLFANGTPQLTDFGIAKVMGAESLTATGTLLGTPAYMAPEQFSGEGDERADVYGLGAILYHCLTGRPPFSGGSPMAIMAQVAKAPPTSPERVRPGLPAGLSAICRTALEKEPGRRFPSAVALSDALTAWLEHPDGPSARGRRAAVITAGVVVLSVVVVAAVGQGSPATAERPSPSLAVKPTRSAVAKPPKPAPARRGVIASLALSPDDEEALRAIRKKAEAMQSPQAWALFVLPDARKLRLKRRHRAAIALYREVLRKGCPASHLREAHQNLAELLLAFPGHEAGVRTCVFESAVRGHSWATKALAQSHRHPDWKRVFPDIPTKIASAAHKIYSWDGKGTDLGPPDRKLRVGESRRLLLAFLVKKFDPPKDVCSLIELNTVVGPQASEAGIQVYTAVKDVLETPPKNRVDARVLGLMGLAAANEIDQAIVRLARYNALGEGLDAEDHVAMRMLLTGAALGKRRCLWILSNALHGELRPGFWASKLIKDPRHRRPEVALRLLARSRALSGRDLRDVIDRVVRQRKLTLPTETDVDWPALFRHFRLSRWLD